VVLLRNVETAGVASGGSRTQNVSFSIADATPLGDYYVLAKIDADGGVGESDEANNVWKSASADLTVAPKPADLVIGAPQALEITIRPGQTVNVPVQVRTSAR